MASLAQASRGWFENLSRWRWLFGEDLAIDLCHERVCVSTVLKGSARGAAVAMRGGGLCGGLLTFRTSVVGHPTDVDTMYLLHDARCDASSHRQHDRCSKGGKRSVFSGSQQMHRGLRSVTREPEASL